MANFRSRFLCSKSARVRKTWLGPARALKRRTRARDKPLPPLYHASAGNGTAIRGVAELLILFAWAFVTQSAGTDPLAPAPLTPSLSLLPSPLTAGIALLPSPLTAGLALAAALVAMLLRKRLPNGMAAGTMLAAVGGAAVLLLTDQDVEFSPVRLAHVMTALAVGCYVAGLIAEHVARRRTGDSLPRMMPNAASNVNASVTPNATSNVRPSATPSLAPNPTHPSLSRVWDHASLLCGLMALALLLHWTDGPLIGRHAWTFDYLVLLLLAGVAWLRPGASRSPYPAVALLACLAWSFVPDWVPNFSPGLRDVGLVLVGGLCLAGVLTITLDDWRQRRRIWLRDPSRSPEYFRPPLWLYCGIVAVCLFVGAGGILFREHPSAAFALWFAALAAFIVGHVLGCRHCGAIGLILTGAGVVAACSAWLADDGLGAMIGIILAGGYLLWLARFWHQQLDDGRAWTTAGRLIPSARNLGYATLLGTLPAICLVFSRTDVLGHKILLLVSCLLVLVAIRLVLRDHLQHRRSAGAAVTLSLVISGSVPIALFITLVLNACSAHPRNSPPSTGLFRTDVLNACSTFLLAGGIVLCWMALVALRHNLFISRELQPDPNTPQPDALQAQIERPSSLTNYGIETYNALYLGACPIIYLIVLSETGFSIPNLIALALTLTAIVGWALAVRRFERHAAEIAARLSAPEYLTAGGKQPK